VKLGRRSFSAADLAFLTLWVVAIVLYLAWPLTHLEAYAWSNDEGLYVQRAALANAGYKLYSQIAFNKPPLLIWILQLTFLVGGQSLASARLVCLALSVLGWLALSAVFSQMWGRWSGLACAWLVLSFPDVPIRAHAVMSDWPAMALALVALAAALAFRRGGHRVWIALSGAAFTAALLIHPLLIYTGAALAAVLLLPGAGERRVRWADLALLAGVGAGIVLVVLLLVDIEALLTWVVGHNVAGVDTGIEISKPGTQRLIEYPQQNPAFVLLAIVGAGVVCVRRHWSSLTVVLAWVAATAIVFLAWTPIWGHYTLFLSLPLAGLAGVGLATAGSWLAQALRARERLLCWQWVLASLGILGLIALVAARWAAEPFHTEGGPEWAPERLAAVSFLEDEVPEGEFVVTDDPLLAFVAGRFVPPELTEVSLRQVLLGNLTAEDIVLSILRSETKAVLFATNRLARIPLLDAWVAGVAAEGYDFGCVSIPTWGCRPIWGYRLDPVDTPPNVAQAVVGETIALEGYGLRTGSAHPGDTLSVVVYWRALGPISLDYSTFIRLVDERGRVLAETYCATLRGTLATSSWPEGLLLPDPHAVAIPSSVEPGDYTLTVALCLATDDCAPARREGGGLWPDGHVALAQVDVVCLE
jgi:hypothetical protein